MNKVTAINLGGKPYQLEDKAYEALQAYLKQAEANLAGDPDKEEVMNDFERAVAEKCEQHLSEHKQVVTVKDMQEILEAMGPVEASVESDEEPSVTTAAPAKRRLYILPNEGMIGGVCAGLGAYFNIDVTVVRIVFVLLAFISAGFWILAYLLLLVIVPAARTPEEIAAAHGETFSAQELLGKAKQKYANLRVGENVKHTVDSARPALSGLGQAIRVVARVVAFAFAIFSAAAIAAATVAFGVTMWALLFNDYHLPQQLHSISTASMVLADASAYYLALLPLILLTYVFLRIARGTGRGLGRQRLWAFIVAIVVWLVALSTLIAVGVSNRTQIRAYADAHPRHSDTIQCDSWGFGSCGCLKPGSQGPFWVHDKWMCN
ncbi:MAG TPA: PspC domain-containing protein [Candidatus Saccharimonadales bacterium]|nr:PspC domain-containing protein [Candidatus Saccharimonadales bacterium]